MEKASLDPTYSTESQIMPQSRNPGYSSPPASDHHDSGKDQLDRVRTTATMQISPELFEKLYLSPQNKVHGDLRKTFGNPTPIAVLGFLVCLTPLSMDLMGWRGAGVSGAAQVASYYFLGGMLSLVGGIFEFFLGNTFPFVVFTSFSGFWFSFGGTLTPSFNAMGAYSSSGSNGPEGAGTRGFNASFAFYLLAWGFVTTIYLICSLRTNVVFVTLFTFLDATFGLLVAVYFYAASGNAKLAGDLQIAAGATALLTCVPGWYILLAQMLESVDFPFQLPVGDLSQFITSGSENRSRKAGPVDDHA